MTLDLTMRSGKPTISVAKELASDSTRLGEDIFCPRAELRFSEGSWSLDISCGTSLSTPEEKKKQLGILWAKKTAQRSVFSWLAQENDIFITPCFLSRNSKSFTLSLTHNLVNIHYIMALPGEVQDGFQALQAIWDGHASPLLSSHIGDTSAFPIDLFVHLHKW